MRSLRRFWKGAAARPVSVTIPVRLLSRQRERQRPARPESAAADRQPEPDTGSEGRTLARALALGG